MYSKRVKFVALCASILMLAGCAAGSGGEAKIMQAEAVAPTGNVQTLTLEPGSLYRSFWVGAELRYIDNTDVVLEVDSAQYVEHKVGIGSEVKAGDVLAVFRKETDDVRLTAIAMELEQIEVQRRDGLDDRAESMEDLQERIDDLAPDANGYTTQRDSVDQQVLLMQMEKMKVEQEQFLLRLDRQAQLLRQERQELYDAREELTVISPVDGIVSAVQYMVQGAPCYRGQKVATIYNPNVFVAGAPDGLQGSLRVGQQVSIEYGRNNDRQAVPGHVIVADSLMDPEQRRGYSAVVLDVPVDGQQVKQVMNAAVVATSMQVDNVLTVPAELISYDDGKASVDVVVDGATIRRYIIIGPTDGENVMVLGGLEYGEEILVK